MAENHPRVRYIMKYTKAQNGSTSLLFSRPVVEPIFRQRPKSKVEIESEFDKQKRD
ncbi:hypothetical protein BDDG_00026 [Blastomyces dermatitidis ATCC 18188]|uniref:Uncharacterized protein n=1 Tax=Ajellomyces dermatitidis (strain ATCC 18188 / CBS 674.68) TaxID=653446 RepID=F2T2H9_AJEDA|nr:hypothetical protein BDDG_00026 [Blastomyces dermatitidis ATCC 18188]